MKSKFLLVSRVSSRSLHDRWLDTDVAREFDVMLSSYDPAFPPVHGEGVYFEIRPGRKVAGYSSFLKERRDLWHAYDYVCFFDEDLEATTETLNRMFRLSAEGSFKISQAALTPDSHYTYAALVQQKAWTLRHVTFIEMMCPIFQTDILERVAHLYHSGCETGIDIVWSQQVATGDRDFAVIDAAPVRHTEPVGDKMAENGFDPRAGYDADIHALLRRHELPWIACVPYRGTRRSGREITSKILLFLAALQLLWSVPLQPPRRKRMKLVAIHLKHIAQSALGRVPRRSMTATNRQTSG